MFTAVRSNNNVVIGGSTLSTGGPIVTVAGAPISLGIGILIVGGAGGDVKTFSVPLLAATNSHPNVVTLGSHAFTAIPNGQNFVFGGSTLSVGSPSVVINNVPVTLATNGLILDPQGANGGNPTTIVITPQRSQGAIVTAGSQVITAIQTGGIVVAAGFTLSTGGPAASISGNVVSVAPGDLVIGGSTVAFTSLTLGSTRISQNSFMAIFAIGGQAYTAIASSGNGKIVTIGSFTFSVGGPPATISGQLISLGENGVVVGSTTVPLRTLASGGASPTISAAIFTIGGQAYTALTSPGSGYSIIIGSSTLSVGGPPVTISGEVISLDPSGVVLGTSTISFSAYGTSPKSIGSSASATLTANSSAITSSSIAPAGKATSDTNGKSLTSSKPGATITSKSMASLSSKLPVIL